MRKSRNWINLAILAMFVAFAYGVTQLYLLRFTAGDVYPPYSSYRADPVGTRAYYESLRSLDQLHVERHAKPFSIESVGATVGNRKSTWMLLGLNAYDPDHIPLDIARGLERIMQQGGRVVLAIEPTFKDLRAEFESYKARMERIERMRQRREGLEEDVEPDSKAERDVPDRTGSTDPADRLAEAPESDESERAGESEESDDSGDSKRTRLPYEGLPANAELAERWGVRLAFDEAQVNEDNRVEAQVATPASDSSMQGNLTCTSVVWFDELGEDWKVLYERDGKPVLIERPFGDGTLVFAADSYFLSNEALRNERRAELLTWLVGPNNLVIFEESHLGVARVPGVMTLIRGYGLYGIFWGLIALGLLFVWKNAIAFVPPYVDEMPSDARHAAGRDSAAGFTNLIRRSIKPRELLHACLAQYKQSLGARRDDVRGPIGRMEAIAESERHKPASEWNPVEAYRAMCKVVDEYRRG